MNRTRTLIKTLKKYLKAKGVTYKVLADEMQLSEAAVKRMFSKESFTLSRLDEICSILDIEIYDLTLMDRQQNHKLKDSLNAEQETALAADEKLGFFLYFLTNGWTVDQILEEYQYTEPEAIRMLAKLENLNLLEVYPGNRVRLKVTANVFWRDNRTLRKDFIQPYVDDFLNESFRGSNERLEFIPGQFSKASLKTIQRKLANLVKEYNQLADMDSSLPIKGRYSTGLFIGFRPWVFSRIAALRKDK